ncbi:long-chain fatty acid--CoA ligase [soil metagenome]
MQPRPWHATYPPGIPFEAPLEEGLTLPVMVARTIARRPDHIAYTCLGVSLSYGALDALATAFAGFLQHRGLQPGDHVALMLPNSIVHPIAMLGVLRAGMAVVSVNPMYTARELAHQLHDSGAKAIVTSEAVLPLLRQIAPEVKMQLVVCASTADLLPQREATGDAWQAEAAFSPPDDATSLGAALAQGATANFTPPNIAATDIAFLQYTGGTTGVSKGAALSHANVIAAAVQQYTWQPRVFRPFETRCITPLPLYHIYPLNVALILLAIGGTNRLVPNPRDLQQLFAEIRRGPFDLLLGLNTLFNGLLASGQLNPADFAETRMVIGAGSTVQQVIAERWKAATGVAISESYGLTECSPGVTSNVLGGPDWTGSIGVPVPSTDVQLIDAEGNPVPIGQPGELCVKGPQVFSGYWQRPDETKKVFTADGWFRTGDIATMDSHGMIAIVDRLKDMILVSGFNVYPNEIEAVVAMMPEVLECACVGVPNERSGEVPHFIVVKLDPALDEAKVIAHCRANLTAYKVPKHISFVAALPKSPVGKILRRELRAELLAAGSPSGATTIA